MLAGYVLLGELEELLTVEAVSAVCFECALHMKGRGKGSFHSGSQVLWVLCPRVFFFVLSFERTRLRKPTLNSSAGQGRLPLHSS